MTPQQHTNVSMVAAELRRCVHRLRDIPGEAARVVETKVTAAALVLEASLDSDPYDLLTYRDEIAYLTVEPPGEDAGPGGAVGPPPPW